METEADTIALAVQLGASMLLVIVCTLVHGLGLVGVSKLLRLRDDRLEEHDFNARAVILMCSMTFSLFMLHMIEIMIFALFYLLVGALGSFQDALHFSASTYATLGRAADYFPSDWGLMGSIEALIGFLLIGWSTAFIFRNMSKLSPV